MSGHRSKASWRGCMQSFVRLREDLAQGGARIPEAGTR